MKTGITLSAADAAALSMFAYSGSALQENGAEWFKMFRRNQDVKSVTLTPGELSDMAEAFLARLGKDEMTQAAEAARLLWAPRRFRAVELGHGYWAVRDWNRGNLNALAEDVPGGVVKFTGEGAYEIAVKVAAAANALAFTNQEGGE